MKRGPILLILILFTILIFILGVQYGKSVHIADEVFSLLLSSTPTPAHPAQTQEDISYKTYTDDVCNISFLYPSTLALKNASSAASLVSTDNMDQIVVQCDKRDDQLLEPRNNVATRSVQLQQFSVIGKEIQTSDGIQIQFSRKHPYNNRLITITVNENLLPLLEKTLEFVRPQ